MRPLYIAGTHRDAGKTTLSVGLLHAFRRKGLRVGYTKPLGQRVKDDHGEPIHDDALVVYRSMGQSDLGAAAMAVPLPQGRVEREVFDLRTDELLAKVKETFDAVARDKDIVLVESMGHVALGSCLGLSAAEVICAVNARALLVSGGGIGRAIDDISLCANFLTSRGADLLGVVINKVWPEKYTRVKQAVTQGLANLGIKSYGTIPFEEQLSCPTMRQVHELVGGELIGRSMDLEGHVQNTIVAAMESSHMVRYLEPGTLVITPGDRADNILAALSANMLGDTQQPLLTGLVLTGGFRPNGTVMRLVNDSGVPVILVKNDTYSVASKFRETVFKITPDDSAKIEAAICLASEYVDIDGIISALSE